MNRWPYCPDPAHDPDMFEPSPNSYSGRVRCKVCGVTGYNVHGGWQAAHSRGHKPCPRCGKPLCVTMNGAARTHGRCPRR